MFTATREIVINAPPQKIFDVLADVERHTELAGSGEVLARGMERTLENLRKIVEE